MLTKFYKMQGIGNDYVYLDCFDKDIENPGALSKRVSDRHFGIGSDGLILLRRSAVADVKMSMFNADGSEAQMCGNGIRCVGKLAYQLGHVHGENLTVETLSGIRQLKLNLKNGEVESVRVNMGAPMLESYKIPVKFDAPRVVNAYVPIAGGWHITCVSMGNPHAVIFTEGVDGLDLPKLGPQFENAPMFPERVNTEFVEALDKTHLKMRVWERGSGETFACGTGACASAVAACLNGISPRGEELTLSLRGGELSIVWDNDVVWMTGPAELVFTGEIGIE